MAKNKAKKKNAAAGRADTVRQAVDQAFSASAAQAEQGRERAQDIVDQLAQAASRVRDVLDELRPPTADDLKSLRQSIASLEKRVAALESSQPAPAKPAAKRAPAKRTPAKRSTGTAAKRSTTTRRASGSSSTRKPAS
jgi:heparin binding hemagglutinin HbhA